MQNLARRLVLCTILALAAAPLVVRAQNIDLVSQLDPYAGDNRYGDVWGEGHHAYLGSFQGSGVAVIDVSVTSAPAVVGTYDPPSGGQFQDLKVRDGIGYFASDNDGGLHIVDVSNPASPQLLAQITSADSGYDTIHNVSVGEGFVYEADSATPTIKVFDVSDPQNPAFVRDIVTPDALFIHDVAALGGRLYASGWDGSTYIYDVSAVASGPPPLLGTVASGSHSHSTWVTSDGAILISSREINDGDVRLYDISDPGAPVLLSTVDQTSLGIESFSPHNPVLFDDRLLFVSWYQAGVVAIDISNPANPVLVGSYDTFPGPVLVEFNGNWGVYPLLGLDRVLLSDLDGGLFVVDATATLPVPVPGLGWPGRLLTALGLATLGASGSSRRTSRGRGGFNRHF